MKWHLTQKITNLVAAWKQKCVWEITKNCEFFCDVQGHTGVGKSWHRRDTPISPPNDPCTHVHRWWHVRLMAPHCTPPPGICLPSWSPQLQAKGCLVGGDGHLQSFRNSWGVDFQCQFNILNCKSGDLRCTFLRLLRGWMGNSGGWSMAAFFGSGWDGGHGGMRYGPLKSPYRPSTSNPATANSIFCNPSVSSCSTPSASSPFSANPRTLKKEKSRVCHKYQT